MRIWRNTILYLPPQHKKLPKADLRMQKCIWLGTVSETGENYVATETGVQKVRTARRLQLTRLQLRPRATEPGFRHTLGATTKHLQPVIRNTVGHATTIVRKETSYTRLWTTDERDGRHRRGTRNKTTTHYVTSTTSVNIDVKFATTPG